MLNDADQEQVMLTAGTFRNGKIERELSSDQLTSALADPKALVWVDVFEPGEAEWESLESHFGFHHLAVEDARKQEQRPKLDEYGKFIFLSLRLWTGFHGATDDVTDATDEVDVFFGANYLVTIHRRDCSPLVEQRDRWLQHPNDIPLSSAYLLYMLMDMVVDTYFPAMDALDLEIDQVETSVYTSKEMPDWTDALLLKKRLLILRQVIAPTRDLMNHFLRAEQPLVPPELRIYFQDVYDHTLRQVEQVDLHRDIVTGVMDAMMAQVSNRLNQVMKTLTVVSIILMTNSLIAGIYGMNFVNMPELKTQNGYFVVLGVMVALTVGLLGWFRRIKWM
jgi:magnesium transporter